MKYLRKTLEFGFSATILSTLLLTACGGGGGAAVAANPAATGGTAVTLTPVKGKFEGKCVVSISNTAGATLFTGTQTINPNGTTTVTLPAGSTGPYLVSIQGDATGTQCLYFNDNAANPRLIAMGASESLNALVSTNDLTAASGVAITSLSEMAYQAASAIHGGHLRNLTESSPEIAQGIAAAVSLAGLTGASAVASIFTPPRTIPASGVAANDDLGRTLVNIANINATKPMDAIRLMSYHAQSAVGVPPSASAVAALPTSPVGQGAAFWARVNANKQAAASAVVSAGSAASFLAEVISASGIRALNVGQSSPSFSTPANLNTLKVTVTNGVINFVMDTKDLISRIWTPQAPTSIQNFVLTTTGWSTTPVATVTMNPDGTIRLVQDGFGIRNFTVVKQNLAGASFASAVAFDSQANGVMNASGLIDPNGQLAVDASGVPTAANIVPAGAFTAGAIGYQTISPASQVASQDIYKIGTMPATAITGPAGQLTALPPTTNAGGWCFAQNASYVKLNTVTNQLDLYGNVTPGVCAAPLAGVGSYFSTPYAFVTVNGIQLLTYNVVTANGAIQPGFMAVIQGKVYQSLVTRKGAINTAGMNGSWHGGIANQQYFTALGLPLN